MTLGDLLSRGFLWLGLLLFFVTSTACVSQEVISQKESEIEAVGQKIKAIETKHPEVEEALARQSAMLGAVDFLKAHKHHAELVLNKLDEFEAQEPPLEANFE